MPDIFDIDQFWTEELMHANEDRLFGCFVDSDGGNGDPLNGECVGVRTAHSNVNFRNASRYTAK